METLLSYLLPTLKGLLPFILLLGVIVFIHELGHFLVARYFGVHVEVFSIGFGRKLFKWKPNRTTYCISLIPLGGYVKMYGEQHANSGVPMERRKEAFSHKSVGQRFLIVLAGPIMNLLLAILLITCISFYGDQVPQAVIGSISPSSNAYKQGLRPGDEILKVEGQKVQHWTDFTKRLTSPKQRTWKVDLLRHQKTLELSLKTQWIDNPRFLSWKRKVLGIPGMTYYSKLAFIGVANKESSAFIHGLRTGDKVLEINGQSILYWRDLAQYFETHSFSLEDVLQFKIERAHLFKKSKKETLNLSLSLSETTGPIHLGSLGIEEMDLFVGRVFEGQPAKLAGIKQGDKLTHVNGEILKSWEHFTQLIHSFPLAEKKSERSPPMLNIQVLQDGLPKNVSITPVQKTQMTAKGKEETRFIIGISSSATFSFPTKSFPYRNPFSALWEGTKWSWDMTQSTLVGLFRMLNLEISPRNIGGVVTIGQVASKSFYTSWISFLKIMALISINLFILNLLPIPVLDGGHLFFFSIEALKGSPLNVKQMRLAETLGFVFLLSLMVFALFNDFVRIFS